VEGNPETYAARIFCPYLLRSILFCQKRRERALISAFCGEYKCAADAKGRVFVPARMREQFGEGEPVILVRSLDACINLYPEENWQLYEEKIESLPGTQARDVKRFFYGSMQSVEMDSQGRVLLPPQLREFAGIDKKILFVGCGDHAEIWDEDAYRAHAAESRNQDIEEILRRNGL